MRNILLLLFMLSTTLIYSQIKSETYEPVLPTSPNVEEFIKYVNFPVNYYTGVPGISIPLSSISIKGFQTNVSLSYHAGGIRVNERASWVGLGWNLNAGGVITREVKGTPDDLEYGYSDPTTGVGQDMEAFFAADLNILPENEDFVENIRTQAADGWIDTQPDIYTFKVGGLSGRFIINYDGQIHQLSHNAIKISGNPQSGFQITDTSGNIYFFDQIEQTMVVPNAGSGDDYTYNSSWYISKIMNPFNQEINFSYQSEGIGFQSPLQQSMTYGISGNYQGCDPQLGTSSGNTFLNIQGKRLAEISFPLGKIKFIALTDRNDVDGNSKQLDQIELWDDTKMLKKYQLTYDYFMPAEKLKLISLQEFAAGGESNPPFEFYYNENHPLPAINAKGQDFWGYYNGKDSNNTLLPLLPDNVISGIVGYNSDQHGDRDVDPAYTAVGTLNTIKYPTGGSTEYFYQSNAYGYIKNNPIVENQRYSGGLRIEKIVKKDEDGTIAMEKHYQYLAENQTRSSGVVQAGNPPYGFPTTNRTTFPEHGGGTPVSCNYYYLSSVPITSYGSSQGSVVSYRRVIEKTISNQDGTTTNGESVYKFTSAYDFDDDYEFNTFPYNERIGFDYRRGLLLKETHYSIKNAIKEKVSEKENNYTYYGQTFSNIFALKAGKNTVVFQGPVYEDDYLTTISLNKYSYGQTHGAFLSNTTTKTFSSSGAEPPVVVSKDIMYANLPYPQPSEEKQIINFGDTVSTRYTYAFNDLADPLMTALTNQNRIAEPVQVAQYRIDSLGVEELLATRRTVYQDFNGFTFPEKIQIAVAQETLQDQINYTHYDGFGNVLEIIKKDGTPVSFIWGYHSTMPIVKLEGVFYADINPGTIINLKQLTDNDINSITEQDIRNEIDGLRLSHPGALISGITYDPLVGVTSSTDTRGYVSFYNYDEFNRFEAIKDANSNSIKVHNYHYAQEPIVYDPLDAGISYGTGNTDHQWFTSNISGGSGDYSYAWFEGIGDSSTDFEANASGTVDTYQLMVDCSATKYVKLVVTDNVTGEVVEQTKVNNNTCPYLPLTVNVTYGGHSNTHQNFVSMVNGGSGNVTYAWYKGVGTSSFVFEVTPAGTQHNYSLTTSCSTFKWMKLVVTDTVTGESVIKVTKSNNSPCSGGGGGGDPIGPDPFDPEQ